MANPFYDPGEQRAAKVNQLFGRIAGRYDLLNDIQSVGLHRLWKRKLVRLAQPRAGERALDICCGTGDLALELAQNGLEVTGLDFSNEMLTVARKRLGRDSDATKAQVQLVQGNAEQLPFPDRSFDIVTVGYGLRNLVSWEKGVGEMLRVARAGGRLLVLDFGKPPNRLLRALYFSYLRTAVPLLGLLFCGDAHAYAYILESLKHYPAQEGVAAAMRQRGMAEVQVINLLGGLMSINSGVKR